MKNMKIDDSFKKPGSVPFKWEIRPGVPKLQNPQPKHKPEPGSQKQHQRKQKHDPKKISPFQETPRKLKPPPAGLNLHAPVEARTRSNSFRSSPHTLSNRFVTPGPTGPDVVSLGGCFPSPLGKLKNMKKGSGRYPRPEPDCYSDLETPSRWSISSRKSVSPLPSSYQSSPRPVFDADWAGFGLF